MKTERMAPTGEPTMTTRQAARRLGVSESFLNKARANGTGPAAYRFGKRVVFRASDVDAYAAAHRCEPAGAASLPGGTEGRDA